MLFLSTTHVYISHGPVFGFLLIPYFIARIDFTLVYSMKRILADEDQAWEICIIFMYWTMPAILNGTLVIHSPHYSITTHTFLVWHYFSLNPNAFSTLTLYSPHSSDMFHVNLSSLVLSAHYTC